MSAGPDTSSAGAAGAGKPAVPEPMEYFREHYLPSYKEAMAECERRLESIASSPGGLLGCACAETLAAGGKRLRPLLVFLAAGPERSLDGTCLGAAVAVELIHMATLVHDDVLDNAELRRGRPTLFARHGAGVSTCAGDYLFASAFDVLAGAGSAAATEEMAAASLGLSLGEFIQMSQAYDYDVSTGRYFERCRLKTSGLFAAACRTGALLNSAGAAAVAAMGRYGDCLGLAFQIADDILDYSGDAARSGKLTGTDLKDGTVTLPLILALERDSSLGSLLDDDLSAERIEEVRERVIASGALEEAERTAYGYVEQAKDALGAAAAEIDTGPLELIAGAAVNRKK